MQNLDSPFPEILIAIVTWLTTSVSAWYFNRKKEQQEVQKATLEAEKTVLETKLSEVDMVERIATIWRENNERLVVQQKDLMVEVDKMRVELAALKEENRTVKAENVRLKKEVEILSKRIKEVEINHG
jgi:cell division protein FtsB